MDSNKFSPIKIISIIIFIALVGYAVFYTKPKETIQEKTNPMEVAITILQEGQGEAVKVGDKITVNYTGMFLDGKKFDSNVDPAFNHVAPFEVVIGVGQVISGWDQGLIGMKVGEKRKLVIPSALAYGERGAGATIPPNTDLVFEVELLKIN
jgi:FKBP-type peptidyl-prolyl cis-trans isomerase